MRVQRKHAAMSSSHHAGSLYVDAFFQNVKTRYWSRKSTALKGKFPVRITQATILRSASAPGNFRQPRSSQYLGGKLFFFSKKCLSHFVFKILRIIPLMLGEINLIEIYYLQSEIFHCLHSLLSSYLLLLAYLIYFSNLFCF